MKGLSKVDQSLQRDNSPGLQLNMYSPGVHLNVAWVSYFFELFKILFYKLFRSHICI